MNARYGVRTRDLGLTLYKFANRRLSMNRQNKITKVQVLGLNHPSRPPFDIPTARDDSFLLSQLDRWWVRDHVVIIYDGQKCPHGGGIFNNRIGII